MVAANGCHSRSTKPESQAAFLQMLPIIRRSAQIAFRKVPPELRHDLVQEAIANSFVAFTRLVERGKADRALASPLARYAIAQVRVGRRVGNRLRISDVLSQYAQFRKQFVVERIDVFQDEEGSWTQMLVEDRRAGPAEIAACRIDFTDWLRRLTARLRRIAHRAGQRPNDRGGRQDGRRQSGPDFPDPRTVEKELGDVSGRDDRGRAADGWGVESRGEARHGFGRGGRIRHIP